MWRSCILLSNLFTSVSFKLRWFGMFSERIGNSICGMNFSYMNGTCVLAVPMGNRFPTMPFSTVSTFRSSVCLRPNYEVYAENCEGDLINRLLQHASIRSPSKSVRVAILMHLCTSFVALYVFALSV